MRFVVDLCAEVASCSYLRQPEICGERALHEGDGESGKERGRGHRPVATRSKWKYVCGLASAADGYLTI